MKGYVQLALIRERSDHLPIDVNRTRLRTKIENAENGDVRKGLLGGVGQFR